MEHAEIESVLPLVIMLTPLFGFLLNGLIYPIVFRGIRRVPLSVAGGTAVLAILAACVATTTAFFELHGTTEGSSLVCTPFEWLSIGPLSIPFSLRIDALSSVMTLIITGVGTLIHIYSLGYMSHEEGVGRYFSYLNLFCFAMLLLVLGESLPLLFFGWEGVGLCSYLLIGYWYEDPAKASAGAKAFIVNRVGDLGFLLGMFLIFKTFGTLSVAGIRGSGALTAIDPSTITWICLFLFIGATGKSAQIPLYVWLPDAMAGPTPVSALIHAATMVTAGVYMIARLNFLFALAPTALSVVAHVGALTAFFAATIGIAQNDIKKVLAYSTVSQLGYMFLACGVGATQTGVFHLMTHAFFKALLFLGAGSVIHGCHHEQDMRKMGGLRKDMPVTFAVMAIGTLAIAGIPFFSGFFSKDEIVYSTLALPGGGVHLYVLALATAFLTAIYMTRMMAMTFFGSHRLKGHAHESPLSMTGPLCVLAVLAALGGFLGVPHLLGHSFGMHHLLSHWLSPVIPTVEMPEQGVHLALGEGFAMVISVVVAVVGIALGFTLFREPRESKSGLNRLLENKYFVDEIYQALIIKPMRAFSGVCHRVLDVSWIDGNLIRISRIPLRFATTIRTIQSGDVQHFSMTLILGVTIILFVIIFLGVHP